MNGAVEEAERELARPAAAPDLVVTIRLPFSGDVDAALTLADLAIRGGVQLDYPPILPMRPFANEVEVALERLGERPRVIRVDGIGRHMR